MNFTPARTKEKQVEHVLLSEYNRYYRLAFSYVHNEADACDIVQNGAYKAIRASKNLKNIEYAGTWVYRIMLNEIFDFCRKLLSRRILAPQGRKYVKKRGME